MPSDRTPAPQRIAKLLARAGIASRREIERMIAEGRIARNGVAIDTPATVLADLTGVTVDGKPVAAPETARLFLYHKPPGLLVTERDPKGRPTIYDRLPKGLPRVMPVGRLDLATEGLLLLTTDGGLKRQLELPATGVERGYRARAYGQVSQAQLEDLIEGVEIEGVRYGSIDANMERRTGANFWIELVLTEGKNREVRRVLEHLGLQISRLIRTRYGPFVLGDLPPGAVVEVRTHDVESFAKNPTRKDLPQPARRAAPVVAEVPREAGPAPAKPKRPPRETKAPRVRADGTLATRGGTTRTTRAAAFRDDHPRAAPARSGSGKTARPKRDQHPPRHGEGDRPAKPSGGRAPKPKPGHPSRPPSRRPTGRGKPPRR